MSFRFVCHTDHASCEFIKYSEADDLAQMHREKGHKAEVRYRNQGFTRGFK